MAQVTTRTKYVFRTPRLMPKNEAANYEGAWKQFERLSTKLRTIWRTKKSSLEVLREERVS